MTYSSVYYRSLKGMLKFFGVFFSSGSKLARPESLSYSNNNNPPVFSLALPSLFSLLCSFNFLPGCLHHRSAVIGASRGLGAGKPTQCHNFAHNTHRRMSPSGPQWVNWSAEAHFYLCHCLPCAMIASKWDEERPFCSAFSPFSNSLSLHDLAQLLYRSDFN